MQEFWKQQLFICLGMQSVSNNKYKLSWLKVNLLHQHVMHPYTYMLVRWCFQPIPPTDSICTLETLWWPFFLQYDIDHARSRVANLFKVIKIGLKFEPVVWFTQNQVERLVRQEIILLLSMKMLFLLFCIPPENHIQPKSCLLTAHLARLFV